MRLKALLLSAIVALGLGLGLSAQGSLADVAKADINDDLIVDNADLAIARAAVGKREGQAGYDPRADMDGNRIITIADLSFVQRYMGQRVTTPTVKINEVESSGGVPGDWVELINTGTSPTDISGLVFHDNDNTHTYTIPGGTTIAAGGYYLLEEAAFGFGLGGADSARLFDTTATTLIDSYTWTVAATTTYGRCPNGTGAFITTTSVTKGAANDCAAPAPTVKINEVESSGGVPGDWVELFNTGGSPTDISGLMFRDNDDTHTYTIPGGTTIPVGGYYLLEEAAFGFGLGGADSARLFGTNGTTLVDSYTWTVAATTTYGRCPNGTGAFTTTSSVTKGAANDCAAPAPTVKINEVESSGGVPGDWVELINTGSSPTDISGWVFRDNDDTHTYTIPGGTTIAAGGYHLLEEAAFGFGVGGADSARLFDTTGTTLIDSYTWTVAATTTYGRCPNGIGAFITTTSVTKGAANDCAAPAPTVKINEVESSGGVPGDWVELINTGGSPADISGWVFRDNDDTHTYTIPGETTIAAGGYYLLEEAAFGFGLGGADSARLFGATGTVIDSYTWTVAATTTYGRCPNGTGAFTTTTSVTKGTANKCPGDPLPWPGDADVQTADGLNVFGGNLSGLVYEGTGSSTPGVLWAVRNGPGSLFRLVFDGSIWTPDSTNTWNAGKTLLYPGSTGSPDSEGVTFADGGSSSGMYVATERDNNANGISRNSILRFDVSTAGATLTATHEWNLTADLPAVGPNLGMEGITWIPDTFLVSQGFVDESQGGVATAYNPADYPNHGTGLFFVGMEGTGGIYAYALNHANGSFTRIATIASGFPGVMDLHFDRELGMNNLWAVCDDTCAGRSAVLKIAVGTGKFAVTQTFDRPGGMPNLNNEGFAVTPLMECVADRRPAFWADDSETAGHAIRRGALTCTPF